MNMGGGKQYTFGTQMEVFPLHKMKFQLEFLELLGEVQERHPFDLLPWNLSLHDGGHVVTLKHIQWGGWGALPASGLTE